MADTNPSTPQTPIPRAVRVLDGERAYVLPLSPDRPLVFGRADRADVVIPQHRVSRLHGMLWWEDGQWLFRDLGSANGSFVYDVGDFERHEAAGDDLPVEGLRDGEGRPMGAAEGVLLGTRDARLELLPEVPPEARDGADPLLPKPQGLMADMPTEMFGWLRGG